MTASPLKFKPLLCAPAVLCVAFCGVGAPAEARQANPVYVDDSPHAWELFRQAEEQIASNLTEAVRSFQELLDEYPLRLIPSRAPIAGSREHFTAVRGRVLRVLLDPEHEPLLERYLAMEQPEAERLLRAGELERLALTRPLTKPGLEAMLRLAQRDLEVGRFRLAVDRLTEAISHPDINREQRRAAHTWHMLGVANHYLGRRIEVDRAIQDLALLGEGHQSLLDHLLDLAEQSPPRGPAAGVSTFDHGLAFDLSDLVAEEIWSFELTEAPLARRSAAQERRMPTPGIRGPAPPRLQQLGIEQGRLATMIPTVVDAAATSADPSGGGGGGVVYVNQGHTITAVDRFTGNRIWERDYVDRPTLLLVDRTDEHAFDPSVIAVQGSALVTITGHAHSTARSSDGRVVRLDARSGNLRWATRLDRLAGRAADRPRADDDGGFVWSEEFEGLFPHGRPLIVDDVVLVKARRVSPQALTSAYLVALDLETGDVRWIRHIASSGSIRRAARAFSAMVAYPEVGDQKSRPSPAPVVLGRGPLAGPGSEVHGLEQDVGDKHLTSDLRPLTSVYLVTAVGAVASVNPRTGEVNWLHRFSVPIQPPPQDASRRPWEVTTPHVTRDRVIAIHPGRRQVAVYDRHSGELLEQHDAGVRETWNSPIYLTGDEEWVYAVSGGGVSPGGFAATGEVRAFRIGDLSAPRWRLEDVQLQGRVHLADVGLIVPAAEGLTIVDRATGRRTLHLPIASRGNSDESAEPTGNAVALDAQIILASDRRIRAYMSLDRAEQMLRERIAGSPRNPEPALSLARLALRGRNFNLALEASSAALDAINASRNDRPDSGETADARQRLVSILLELDREDIAQSRNEIESVFALLEKAAQTPQQRLAHRLAYGDRLATIDPARALGIWQDVLSDSVLADTERSEHDVARHGREWALQRIEKVVARAREGGAELYEPLAAAARRKFDHLTRQASAVSPEQLLGLADEFPLADAAVDALLAGSRLLADDEEHQRALSALGTYLSSDHRVRDAYIALAQELGLHARAAAALEPRAAEPPQFPRIGAPSGPAKVLAGRALLPPAYGEQTAPTDRLLLADGATLTMLAAASGGGSRDDLTTLWTTTLDSAPDAMSIVRWSERDLLIGVGDENDPAVYALDPVTGAKRWRTPRFIDLFGTAPGIAPASGPGGERFDPSAVLAMADDHVLLLVQRSGNVVAFDMASSGRTLWSRTQRLAHEASNVGRPPLSEVHLAQLRGGILALAGTVRRGVAANDRSAAIVALDAMTGRSVSQRAVLLHSTPTWIELPDHASDGRLLYVTADAIGCVDLWRGEHAWVNAAADVVGARRGWVVRASGASDRLFFEDASSNLRAIDVRSGTISDAFKPARIESDEDAPNRPQQPRAWQGPLELLAVSRAADGSDDVIAHYRQRIIRYSPDGRVRGADVVRDVRNFAWLLTGRDSSRDKSTSQQVNKSTAGSDSRAPSHVDLLTPAPQAVWGGACPRVDPGPASGPRPSTTGAGLGRGLSTCAMRLVLINSLPPIQELVQGAEPQPRPVPGAAAIPGPGAARGQPPGAGARRTQHRYHVYLLSDDARMIAEPAELPPLPEPVRAAALIDDWLVLSLSERTIAVPMR